MWCRSQLPLTVSVVAMAACGGGAEGPTAPVAPPISRSAPETSGDPSTSLDPPVDPPDDPAEPLDVPIDVWIDLVGRSIPVPEGETVVVAIQAAMATAGTSGRIEVQVPVDGVDEQAGVIGVCAGLPEGDLGGAAVIAIDERRIGVDDGLVGARVVILDETLVPGELHAASLEWATTDGVVRAGMGELRLSADARSGTFVGQDDAGTPVTGRFDCFGEGDPTAPVVGVRERELRSIEITADLEGDDWIDGLRLEADETTLTGVVPARDGVAYCSGVVGLDEPYLVRLESSAVSDRDDLVSVELLTDRPAEQRERVDATLILETDGDRLVFEDAVMELSTDGTGGYFEGVIPGGEEIRVTGFWLCE